MFFKLLYYIRRVVNINGTDVFSHIYFYSESTN